MPSHRLAQLLKLGLTQFGDDSLITQSERKIGGPPAVGRIAVLIVSLAVMQISKPGKNCWIHIH